MMIHDESTVEALFQKSLIEAKELLARLGVYSGRSPSFTGLSGWVFEQTIQHCIREELRSRELTTEPVEQVGLGGRVKVDLLVGGIAIEIKTSGLFGRDEIPKYEKYQSEADTRGYRYVFLSRGETTYRTGIIKALGQDNVVMLDGHGEWERFIGIITDDLMHPKCNKSLEKQCATGDE